MEQNELESSKTICAACLRKHDQKDLICLDNKWICAECKPVAVQMMQEGLSFADITIARHKRILVMGKNASLPDRCVKCNAPANAKRLKKKLYWHSPVVYFLLPINILLYALVALVVRKNANVEIGLCERHLSKRKKCILAAWILFLVSLALIIGGLIFDMNILIFTSILFFISTIITAISAQVVTARRIDSEYVWLNGVCKEYLNSVPTWVKLNK